MSEEAPRSLDVAEQVVAMLRTPEPMSRSLLAGAKTAGIGALTFWTLSALVGPELYSPMQIIFFSATMAGLEIARRRSGEAMPSSVLRVGGAAMVAAGGLVTAAAILKGDAEPMPFGVALVVAGAAALVFGLRKGRTQAARAAQLAQPVLAERRIARKELARRLERQKAAATAKGKGALWAFGGTLASFAALIFGPELLGVDLGLPDAAYGVMLVGFWAAVGGFIWKSNRDTRAIAEAFDTLCPSCSKPLIGSSGNLRLMQMLDEVGLCPNCGVKVTED